MPPRSDDALVRSRVRNKAVRELVLNHWDEYHQLVRKVCAEEGVTIKIHPRPRRTKEELQAQRLADARALIAAYDNQPN